MAKKITIEFIEGEMPKDPVDVTKALKSEPAFPVSEAKVEAYHGHGHGGGHGGGGAAFLGGVLIGAVLAQAAPPPPPPPVLVRCPNCGGVLRVFGLYGGATVVCRYCGCAFMV